MPPASPGPIMRRRRLGVDLRRLREAAGLTGDQVIERIGWASASKLSRLENGRSRPDPQDVRVLLDLYGADAAAQEELLAFAEAGDIKVWLKNFPVMTQQQRSWAELEAGCAEISEYNPVLVPGLLQTPEYAQVRIVSAREVSAGAGEPEPGDEPETEVQARMARQSLLTREPHAPRYTAVLEEAALVGRRAGPPEVLREQLVQLCHLSQQPNVTLHVLLRDTQVGNWYLPPTAFSVYRFADPLDPETLAIEGGFTDVMSTEAITLNSYKVVFEWLCTAALSKSDTRSWLIEATGRLTEAVPQSTVAFGPATAPSQRRGDSGRLTDR
ncbi:helix-turn-helix domain-containing protein [Micromonospora sp. DT201]|uniref:helix-turn-helix domain-containing protein n=1 Tax=Micromonospora sp. DT201 TaxID=3393442 RepID=UPI003CF8879E